VSLLQSSSGSYQETEAANQAGAAASSLSHASGAASSAQPTTITGLISALTILLTTGVAGGLSSNLIQVPLDEVGNFTSAESDLIGMGGGGLLSALAGPPTASADFGGLGSALAGDVSPAAAVGGAAGGAGAIGAALVLAAAGGGSSIGQLSVPPSWAGGAGVPAGSAPVTLASQSWAAGAPTGGMSTGSPSTMAGMPALRRQAQGHADGSQADTHRRIHGGQRWPEYVRHYGSLLASVFLSASLVRFQPVGVKTAVEYICSGMR
jgi:hypothetical protein